MLTIFSTPKPFRAHAGVIQRNAIKSWILLHPECEVILFGDEEGAAEVAREFGIHHEPEVRRNEYGTKYLNYIFARAQEIAKHRLVCYVNCDIILMGDFFRAVKQVSSWRKVFLMVGIRQDVNIAEPWEFAQPDWEERLRAIAAEKGRPRPPHWIDYFVFPRGIYRKIPPFVIGRLGWDNWLLWKAWSSRIPVVDASAAVLAVHQNHDYSYHPLGEKGVWEGEESQRNYRLAGSLWNLHSIEHATYRLDQDGIHYNWPHWLALARQDLRLAWGMVRAAPRKLRRILVLRRRRHQPA